MELCCPLLGVWEATVVSWAENTGQVWQQEGRRGSLLGEQPTTTGGHVFPSGQSKWCSAAGRAAGKVVQPRCARSMPAARGQALLPAHPESHVESVNH